MEGSGVGAPVCPCFGGWFDLGVGVVGVVGSVVVVFGSSVAVGIRLIYRGSCYTHQSWIAGFAGGCCTHLFVAELEVVAAEMG